MLMGLLSPVLSHELSLYAILSQDADNSFYVKLSFDRETFRYLMTLMFTWAQIFAKQVKIIIVNTDILSKILTLQNAVKKKLNCNVYNQSKIKYDSANTPHFPCC